MYRYLPNILTSYSTHMQHSPRVIFFCLLRGRPRTIGGGSRWRFVIIIFRIHLYMIMSESDRGSERRYIPYVLLYTRVYLTHIRALLFHCWTHRYEREKNKEIMLKLHHIHILYTVYMTVIRVAFALYPPVCRYGYFVLIRTRWCIVWVSPITTSVFTR